MKKIIILGVIVLFVGVGFQPAFALNFNSSDYKFLIDNNPVNPSNVTFSKKFGGTSIENGFSVQQTTDGGYIVVGCTSSFGAGGDDFWLIKTDSYGNKEWDKTFGGTEDDVGYCVQLTNDGGYIIAGVKDDYSGGDGRIWLIKTDTNGNMVWDKTFEELAYHHLGLGVQQTTDGGYIIAGGVWLIKTDSNGNREWSKALGVSVFYVQQTMDGGYIITGGGAGDGTRLIKTNSTGYIDWNKTFGGEHEDKGLCVQQTSNGGYIITGATGYFGEIYVWLIKTDTNGNMVWDRKFGYDTCGYSVQ